MHAMRCQCAFLRLSDPALQCQLSDTPLLPNLRYAGEVWAVDPKLGEAAEVLHRQFLQQLLVLRKGTNKQNCFSKTGTVSIADPVLTADSAISQQGHEHASLSHCQACCS
jgi:hypothetical protein